MPPQQSMFHLVVTLLDILLREVPTYMFDDFDRFNIDGRNVQESHVGSIRGFFQPLRQDSCLSRKGIQPQPGRRYDYSVQGRGGMYSRQSTC